MTADLYQFLYRDLTLQAAGLVVGTLLLAAHAFAWFRPEPTKAFLAGLPRNEKAGIGILALAFAWALLVWSEMDLGEFFTLKRPVQIALVAGFFLVSIYVKEFIAVRATGFLLILAACPVLDAAFLQPPQSRLLLVALAYAWIVLGMFWVGMPYLMRDQIKWAMASPGRWKLLAGAGAAYGAAILACALAFY